MKFKADDACEILGCTQTATRMAVVVLGTDTFYRRICEFHSMQIFAHPDEYGIEVKEIVPLESHSPS